MADYTNMTLEEKKQKLAELKNKLAELKATQELSGQSKGFESAIDKMMDYDPNQAFNLMDRQEALEIKRGQALTDKGFNPEEARRQLRINADRDANMANNPNLSKEEQKIYRKRSNIYLLESKEPNPSTQRAAEKVASLITGGVVYTPDVNKTPDGGGAETTDVKTDTKSTVKTMLDALKGKYKYKSAESKSELYSILKVIEDATDLAISDKNTLKEQIERDYNLIPDPPKKVDRPTSTSKDWLDQIKPAISTLALGSAVSNLDYMIPADRQILWKVNQRIFTPEAVNEGDLNLGRSLLDKVLTKFTGVVPPIAIKEAKLAKDTIKKEYDKAKRALSDIDTDKNVKYISEGTHNWIQNILKESPWNEPRNLKDGLRTEASGTGTSTYPQTEKVGGITITRRKK